MASVLLAGDPNYQWPPNNEPSGKENYELVGWQVEDVYQNLAITYIFNTSVNNHIDKKLFKLPTHD